MIDAIVKERIKKRDKLIDAGFNVYPSRVEREFLISEVLKRFETLLPFLFSKKYSIVGRIMSLRIQGGIVFADLKDETGTIQIVLLKKLIKEFVVLKDNLDLGDFLGVTGVIFKTKAGQKSIRVNKITVAAKALRPIPSTWYGLKDTEERFRKKYLDLILNNDARERLVTRSQIIATLRKILAEENFLEVETPMLQSLPGGAIARPFKTHHNALNLDFYLRIAPELYLKRLLVGGFEKIYEIGRNFRNEGMDRDHNPEFTMLELYWAYKDYEFLMRKSQEWLLKILIELNIKKINFQGKEINFSGKWKKFEYNELIKKYSGKSTLEMKPEEIDEIFKKEVRPNLIDPTFVIKYPKIISPLAKSCEDNPKFTERFQLIIGGTELINAFSELNNPEDQRERMQEQEKLFREGNEEASRLDEDFLEALEYGMPPAAGMGMGIDRLISILTGSHAIKEVIIFPTLKSK